MASIEIKYSKISTTNFVSESYTEQRTMNIKKKKKLRFSLKKKVEINFIKG